MSDKQQIILTEKQEYAINLIKQGKNIFITGPGGVGKGEIIRYYKRICTRPIAVTSLTGISSILIDGQTLHSWAGIGLGTRTTVELIKKIKGSKPLNSRWNGTQVLVIDEISMLSPELFEKLEEIARNVRHNDAPFGGIQLILSGDFAQLKPVDSKDYCFQSERWDACIDETVYLDQIIRQQDSVFQKCLNEVRLGSITEETKEILKSRYKAKLKVLHGLKPTRLYSKRVDVNSINDEELSKITFEIHEFYEKINISSTRGSFISENHRQFLIDRINKSCRVLPTLKLAKTAQVMLLTNLDPGSNLVNGSRGVVEDFAEDGFPIVKFANGIKTIIKPHSWILEDERQVCVEKVQVPLILAWAATIHSSQGQSLDLVSINLGQSIFEYGQAYVALSRVRTLEGLRIVDLDFSRMVCHPKVKEFYEKLIVQNESENEELDVNGDSDYNSENEESSLNENEELQ